MDAKKILLATGAGGLTLFALGFIIYELLFGNATFTDGPAASTAKDPIAFWAIIVMELLFGALLTLVFDRWAGIKTFATGAKAGAWIGAILGAAIGLNFFAVTEIANEAAIIFEAVIYAIRFAVAGGVVGMVLGVLDKGSR